jgi:hypothetical protein
MVEKWRGQLADIEIDDDQGNDVPLGIIDEPEVTVSKNIEQLRGAGDITWQDLQQTELTIEVSGTVMEWDLNLWKELVGYDEATDKIRTDEEVPTWTTSIIYENTAGDTAVFPVQECHTEDLPLGGSREEWIGMDFSFTGRTIQDVDTESTSTA